MLVMGAALLYGFIRFPDGPIHACVPGRAYAVKQHPEGYCGKQGQPHTLADYRSYREWTTAMLVGWPFGLVLLIILHYANRKR